MTNAAPAPKRSAARVVLVTGLSGAGKASILRALEDLEFEAIDNPPMLMIEELVRRDNGNGSRRIAVGVDARTRGFDPHAVLGTLARLRANPTLSPELIYAWAEETVLLRRFTETRRRHPLSPHGTVAEGIAAEQLLTAELHQVADLVLDTSDLPLAGLRQAVERRYGLNDPAEPVSMSISLISFAFPAGLPREADMVFDARFLLNPHYVTDLRHRTGLEAAVGAYVERDPDFGPFLAGMEGLLGLVLPRFVQEGKKYATVAVGCTGGRHRSVYLVETLARNLVRGGWRVSTTHRELAKAALASSTGGLKSRPESGRESGGPGGGGMSGGALHGDTSEGSRHHAPLSPVQAREA